MVSFLSRPEKNHKAQVEAFAKLLNTYPKYRDDVRVKLILLGGSRNAEDAARVKELQSLAKELKVDVCNYSPRFRLLHHQNSSNYVAGSYPVCCKCRIL